MDGEISGAELEDALESEDPPLVVDIRSPQAFGHERITDSENIPLSELPAQIDRIDGEEHVVTVCPHGKASVRAAKLITSFEGFDGTVESLECGLSGWEGPVESDRQESAESPDAPF